MNSRAILLLKDQKDDGSWKNGVFFCNQIGKNIMQVKNSITSISRKHPLVNRDDSSTLFCTLLAVEFIKRQNLTKEDLQEAKLTDKWHTKAESYIQSKITNEFRTPWLEKVRWLLDGDTNPDQFITCDKCETKRPTVAKFCPFCANRENDHLLIHGIADNDYTLDLSDTTLHSVLSINNIDWSGIIGCHWIPGGLGSFGVIAVELPKGIVICKCAGNGYRAEYLGYKLASALGLKTPEMRIVSRDSQEGQEFLTGIRKAPFSNAQDAQRVSKYKMYSQFFVMEYVPGQETLRTEPERAELWFSNPDFIHSLCEMMAFDILINNFDRIPIAWENTGNAKNVMICMEDNTPYIICVDQLVGFIVDSFYKNYEKSLQSLINTCHVVSRDDSLSEENRAQFSHVIEFFAFNSGFRILDEHIIQICKQLPNCLRAVVEKMADLTLNKLFTNENEPEAKLLLPDSKFLQMFEFVVNVSCSCFQILDTAN